MQKIVTCFLTLIAAIAFIACPRIATAVFDDFSDFNDTANPAWTHLTWRAPTAGSSNS